MLFSAWRHSNPHFSLWFIFPNHQDWGWQKLSWAQTGRQIWSRKRESLRVYVGGWRKAWIVIMLRRGNWEIVIHFVGKCSPVTKLLLNGVVVISAFSGCVGSSAQHSQVSPLEDSVWTSRGQISAGKRRGSGSQDVPCNPCSVLGSTASPVETSRSFHWPGQGPT